MSGDTIATPRDAAPVPSGSRADVSSAVTSADGGRLLLLSFGMLFVELALIRWTAANNVYLASLTNFVLLSRFLGIGIGILRVFSPLGLLALVPVALAVLVGLVLAF